ncbi:MAG TPA: PepSY domain-containing protein [Burkholderiaceae bacterium]|nr:PepSY domain-containing protein [Burkholderiaceae bacterium]
MTLTDHLPPQVSPNEDAPIKGQFNAQAGIVLLQLNTMAVAAALMAATGVSHASTPQEKVECTQVPRTQWMSEAQARKLFKADTYALVKFKISKGNCHEFYAVDHQGGVVEAYMHPVTGAQVRITRIPAPVQNQTPSKE